jgi:hypothetical protein
MLYWSVLRLILPCLLLCSVPISKTAGQGLSSTPPDSSPAPSPALGPTCWGCKAEVDGTIEYRGVKACAPCRDKWRASSGSWSEKDIIQLQVHLFFGFFICLISGIVVTVLLGLLQKPPVTLVSALLAVTVGYIVFFSAAALLTYAYVGSLEIDAEGYRPPGALNLVLVGWFVAATLIQFTSCRFLLRARDGSMVGSWFALGVSLAMLPGLVVSLCCSALAGQGP